MQNTMKRVGAVLLAIIMIVTYMPGLTWMQEEAHAATDLETYFAGVSSDITVADDADWPWAVDTAAGTITSTNPGQGSSNPTATAMDITIAKAGALSFKASTDGTSYSIKYQYYINDDSSNAVSFTPEYASGEYSKEVKVEASAGDKITIYFYRSDTPSSSGTPTRDLVLSNFSFTPYSTVSFPNMPDDCDYVFADASTYTQYTVKDKKVSVPDGTYVWQASKFGYETAQNAVTVSGADVTISDTLTEKAKNKLAFDIQGLAAGDEATVTVKSGDLAMTAEADGSYNIPDGEYSYAVKAKGYKTVKGTVTMEGAEKTETITMVEGLPEWEGNVATEFDGGDGSEANPYEIANGDQLAYMAKVVNESSTSSSYRNKYFVLTNDILLADLPWAPIGSSTSNYFRGSFDGQGHTVSGLNVNGSNKMSGLFGYAEGSMYDSPSTVIKNITVSGSVSTDYGSTSGQTGAGGIAGCIKCATIENCANYAEITNTYSNNGNYAGGIVGYLYGSSSVTTAVRNSANFGIVNGTKSTSRTGGIAGSSYMYGTFANCYNAGEVAGTQYAGGIVGYNSSGDNITNCYNRAKVTGNSKYTGALIGYKYNSSSTLDNCYWTKNSASKAVGSGSGATNLKEFTSADDAGQMITDLGDAFVKDNATPINENYPILTWQKVEEEHTHEWGEPTYTWNEGDTKVTAKRVCATDETHIEEETVDVVSEVTIKPTKDTAGKKTLTATFENAAFKTKTKEVEIPAYGEQKVKINIIGQGEKNTIVKENGKLAVFNDLEVSSDLAQQYGYDKDYEFMGKVTALDALIAIHKELYGEAFDENPTDYLVMDGPTMRKIFKLSGLNCMFHVNDEYPCYEDQQGTGSYPRDTVIADGDDIRFFKVYGGSTDEVFNTYHIFNKKAYSFHEGDSAELEVDYKYVTAGSAEWGPWEWEPAEDAVVYVKDSEDNVVTKANVDEDGLATIKDIKPGEYYLVVGEFEESMLGVDSFSTPYATLTVEAHDWSPWTITTYPTLQDDGERQRTCATCNKVETETIPHLTEATVSVRFNDNNTDSAKVYKDLYVRSDYAYKAGLTTLDDMSTVSMMDALVAAHMQDYGDSFKASEDKMDIDSQLIIFESQWGASAYKVFGVANDSWKILNNDSSEGVMSIAHVIGDGDLVSVAALNDPYWGDMYIYTDSDTYTADSGSNVRVQLNALAWGAPEAVSGANVILRDKNGDTEAEAVTDENGVAEFTVDHKGTYKAVVTGTQYEYALLPPEADVTVEENAHTLKVARADAIESIRAYADENKDEPNADSKQVEIEALKAENMIKDAETEDEIAAALENGKSAIDSIVAEAAQELADAKEGAQEQVNKVKPEDFVEEDQPAVEYAVEEANEAIANATTPEEVSKAVENMQEGIKYCTTKGEALDNAKEAAEMALDMIDPEEFVAEDQQKVKDAVDAAREAIDKAATPEEATKAVEDLADAIKDCTTQAEADEKKEEELAAAKKAALEEINKQLADNADKIAEEDQVKSELAALKGIMETKDAETKEAVEAAVQKVKDSVSKLVAAKEEKDKKAAEEAAKKKAAEEAAKKAAEEAKAAEEKAKKVKTVTVNTKKVTANAVDKVVKKAGGSNKYITKVILGKKVRKVNKKAFAKYKKAKTLVVKTKKLKKKTVKASLKGSKITKVQVKVGSKKVNKKFVKKYKKIFTKKVVGAKVKVK